VKEFSPNSTKDNTSSASALFKECLDMNPNYDASTPHQNFRQAHLTDEGLDFKPDPPTSSHHKSCPYALQDHLGLYISNRQQPLPFTLFQIHTRNI
jgi:hypothetical protein